MNLKTKTTGQLASDLGSEFIGFDEKTAIMAELKRRKSRGHAELVSGNDGEPDYRDEDDYRDGEVSPAMLAADRRSARNGLSVIRFSSGETMTQNSRGRCEDAPCCGCCG